MTSNQQLNLRRRLNTADDPTMRVFAVSDIHVDYEVNASWITNISSADYRNDVLILAGDVTDNLRMLEWCLTTLANRFLKVLFVPGNHDLWVIRDGREKTSLQKFEEIVMLSDAWGVSMRPFQTHGVSIFPLLGWYDYSFGQPSEDLRSQWMDYHACRWPAGFGEAEITAHFLARNSDDGVTRDNKIITFSHFLPRIDVMPKSMPKAGQWLYPVLGTNQLDGQLRKLRSSMHIYGHSHVNRQVTIDGVSYINNAFGYPHETAIAAKRLLCIYDV